MGERNRRALVDEVRARRQLPSPDRARLIRKLSGVSLRRFADELECDHTTIARYERGVSMPRGDLAVRYTALLAELEQALA